MSRKNEIRKTIRCQDVIPDLTSPQIYFSRSSFLIAPFLKWKGIAKDEVYALWELYQTL